MKINRLLAVTIACLVYTTGISQLRPLTPNPALIPTTEIFDINGKPWNINNPEARVNGTPWMCTSWNMGYVKLTDGKRADSVLLNFDMEYNRVVFTINSIVYEFSSMVQEAVFDYTENGITKTAVFRTGYPEKNGHKTTTLYQVLSEGPKYELVQYADKKTMERRSFNTPTTINYELSATLYIYDPAAKTLEKIKTKKSSVIAALPGKEEAIEKICRENNLDLKSIDQLALLVSRLQ